MEELISLVTPDTVLFFDGSHRSFPASDVTIFVIEILPRLPDLNPSPVQITSPTA